MNTFRELKIGVTASVIATFACLWFLEPLFRLFGRLIFSAGSYGLQAYTDRLFEQAALLTPPDPALYVLIVIFLLIDSFLVTLVVAYLRPKAKPTSLPQRHWKLKAICFIGIIPVFLSLFSIYSLVVQHRLISSFRQHIAAIAPYITEEEEERLVSRWTQMKSESDYLLIYTDLAALATAHSITLPPNRVFDIKSL